MDMSIQLKAADGAICYANWAAAGLFEQKPEALLGTPWPHARFARGADGAPLTVERLPLWRSLHQGETVTNAELWLELPSGSRHAVLANSAPLRDRQGRITGALVAFRDVSQLRALQETLTRLNGRWRDESASSPSGFVRAHFDQTTLATFVQMTSPTNATSVNGAQAGGRCGCSVASLTSSGVSAVGVSDIGETLTRRRVAAA